MSLNMSQYQVESRTHAAKVSSFKGSIAVRLDSIRLANDYPRDLDKKNIERLKRIFEIEGCLRLDAKNHVPVVVEKIVLFEQAWSARKRSEPYPRLEFGEEDVLKCLHGRHRILAAYDFLPRIDQWWIVDVYVEANEYLQRDISQDYENSSNISDGEIWRHIRLCNKDNNNVGENQWRSRLSKGKDKDLCQLLKHSRFCQAFDNLLDIPGLWVGLKLGALHRFLTLNCDEELLRYLHCIRSLWSRIFTGHLNLMGAVDYKSVQILQLRAPTSARDFAKINENMSNGTLFPAIQDAQVRAEILRNIFSIERIIPSIFTFFEDLKYLEPLADAMKKLVGRVQTAKTSVYREFQHAFAATGNGSLKIEVSEGTYRFVDGGLPMQMEMGYRQLWMYAMRHFPELVSVSPRKENGEPKPPVREVDHNILLGFTDLACGLGFDSADIQMIRSVNSKKNMIREFLLNARFREFYSYSEQFFEACVEDISLILNTFIKKAPPILAPNLVAERFSGDPLRRCGRPFQFDYERDKRCLFFDNLHSDLHSRKDMCVSSFHVREAFYFAFFGTDDFSVGSASDRMETDIFPTSRPVTPSEQATEVQKEQIDNITTQAGQPTHADSPHPVLPEEPNPEADVVQEHIDHFTAMETEITSESPTIIYNLESTTARPEIAQHQPTRQFVDTRSSYPTLPRESDFEVTTMQVEQAENTTLMEARVTPELLKAPDSELTTAQAEVTQHLQAFPINYTVNPIVSESRLGQMSKANSSLEHRSIADGNLGKAKRIALDTSNELVKIKITYPDGTRAISTKLGELNTLLTKLMLQNFILVNDKGFAITNRAEYLKSSPRHFYFKSKKEFNKGNSQPAAGSNVRTVSPISIEVSDTEITQSVKSARNHKKTRTNERVGGKAASDPARSDGAGVVLAPNSRRNEGIGGGIFFSRPEDSNVLSNNNNMQETRRNQLPLDINFSTVNPFAIESDPEEVL